MARPIRPDLGRGVGAGTTHFPDTARPDRRRERVWLGVAKRGFAQQPPALIWPADRAWFVAGDVDLDSTYVGGTAALITALLGHPGLEGWAVDATDDVSLGSDAINAP